MRVAYGMRVDRGLVDLGVCIYMTIRCMPFSGISL